MRFVSIDQPLSSLWVGDEVQTHAQTVHVLESATQRKICKEIVCAAANSTPAAAGCLLLH